MYICEIDIVIDNKTVQTTSKIYSSSTRVWADDRSSIFLRQ